MSSISVADPFDLPEWLGTQAVTWHSVDPMGAASPHVRGALVAADQHDHELDLLAVDAAYPTPVCPEAERRAAHQAWQFGEVVLFDIDGRLTAGVPVNSFDANLACETIRRVARSVGADRSLFTVSISL